MRRGDSWRVLLGTSAAVNVAVMMLRPAAVFLAQAGISLLLGSWEAARAWWPFQMILANCLCLAVLVPMTRNDGIPLAGVYLRPFDEGAWGGRLAPLLRERRYARRSLVLLYDAGLFIAILCTLGVVAFFLVRQIDQQLQANAAFVRSGALPFWARVSVTILLPATMPLAEVPWYLGYFFPKLERLLGGTARAFALTTAAFALQHCVQPLFFDAGVTALRFFVELPVILLAAWVMRAAPRLTPGILALHFLMALQVSAGYGIDH